MLRNALRFIAGAAAGFAVWWYGTPAYHQLLAAAAGAIRLDPRFAEARFVAVGRTIEVVRAAGHTFPSVAIRVDEMTYNIILFAGLFATNRHFFRDRNMRRFLLSLAVLAFTHFLAVVVSVESKYAMHFGPWSAARYGDVERDVWNAIAYSYTLVGMFAVPFACWWFSSAGAAPAADRARDSRKRPAPR